MQLPKAVCFDLDGVLIDATDWHFQALNKALGLFGYSIGQGDHMKVYNGLPTKEKLKIMSQTQGLPEGLHHVIREQKKIYTNELIQLHCRPSYDKLLMLKYLQEQNIKLACCSNAIQESVEDMLSKAGIDIYFDEIIGNDVGFASKPAPDIYLEAFRRLKINAEDIWVIEDAPHGIQAAIASGVGKVIEVSGYEQVNLNLFL